MTSMYMLCVFSVSFLFFFFSSRRRHTRWPRDWSSDVCSSDLHFEPSDPLAITGGVYRLKMSNGPLTIKTVATLLRRSGFRQQVSAGVRCWQSVGSFFLGRIAGSVPITRYSAGDLASMPRRTAEERQN